MDKVELNKQLIVAIYKHDHDALKECVEKGADVNTFEIDGKEYNPLYCCIITQDTKAFEYLTRNGADVTEKIGHRKQSLLFCACHSQDLKISIVQCILENGGIQDINYAPEGGRSPMEVAKVENPLLAKTFERVLKSTENKGR